MEVLMYYNINNPSIPNQQPTANQEQFPQATPQVFSAPAQQVSIPAEPKQMKYGGMDEANQKAMNVWATQGESAMLKHIMTREDGTPMSYAESRMIYG